MAARNSGSRAWARRRESRSTPSATCSSATAAAQFSRSAPAGRFSCSRRSSLPSRRTIWRSALRANCSLPARQHRVSTACFASIRRARSAPFFEDWAGRRGSRSTARGISTSPHRTLDAAVSCESLPMAKPNKCSAAAALWGSLSCRGIAPSSLPAARSSALTGTSRGSRCRDNPTMKAEIIAVGSELLTPDRVDTNSLFLTGELNRLGIEVMSKIEARFRQIGRPMSTVNARQALVPEGATVLDNARGTAPGLWLEARGHIVILLPGPPHELKAMFGAQVAARLARLSNSVRLVARELRVAGMGESDVDQRIAPIYMRHDDVQTTILTAPGEIQIHLRTWSADAAAAQKLLQQIEESIVLALGEAVFTTEGESMEEVVARELTIHQATIATAESCTGGLLAERLTRISGSSAYFLGGVVSYSNTLKSAWVDVPAEIIESRGAVSSEVAMALADGIRRRTGATLGVGITGIAGPGGGSEEKPVGSVHVAIAHASGSKERGVHYPGERDRIRWQASQTAMDLVRRYFLYASQPKSAG